MSALVRSTRRLPVWLQLVAVLFLAGSMSGCMSYLIAAAYFIGGPPMVEPDFDKVTHKSMTDKDITVAVLCMAPKEIKYNFDDIDKMLGTYVTYRLHAKKIKMFRQDVVQAWLDKHDDWDKPEEIGAALEANYVIVVDLHSYTLYAENSSNLYQGRAECIVSVVEMNKEDKSGEVIYTKEINSRYPLAVPRPTSETEYDTFRKEYLSRLSDEIGRLFYEYEDLEDISSAT